MKYAWLRSYHYDEQDRFVHISDEEFSRLVPFQYDLLNGISLDDAGAQALVWETLNEREDAQLRSQEVKKILSSKDIIEIAVC